MTRIPPHLSPPDSRSRIGHAVPLSVEETECHGLLAMTLTSLNHALGEWLPLCPRSGVTLVTGGWEDWAQMDLLGWMNQSLEVSPRRVWDVQRNARIHADPDARVDLLFNTTTYDQVHPMLAIEILAESPLVPRADFLNRMHHEAEQLRSQYLVPRYASARRMMLALTVDPSTPTVLQRHGFGAVVSTPKGCSAMWRDISG